MKVSLIKIICFKAETIKDTAHPFRISHYLSSNVTDRLNNAASFNGATSNARQQGSESKVVSRRYNLNLILRVIQILQETSASPSSSEQHHLLLPGSSFNNTVCSICFRVGYKSSTTAVVVHYTSSVNSTLNRIVAL